MLNPQPWYRLCFKVKKSPDYFNDYEEVLYELKRMYDYKMNDFLLSSKVSDVRHNIAWLL